MRKRILKDKKCARCAKKGFASDNNRPCNRCVQDLGNPWCSQRQKTVTNSSCETEYVVATEAAKEAIWIKAFINNLRLPEYDMEMVPPHIDNMSALKLAKNPKMHSRTKHFANKYYFIRQCVDDRSIHPIWIKGTENPADTFTKKTCFSRTSRSHANLEVLDLGGVLICGIKQFSVSFKRTSVNTLFCVSISSS